MSLLMDALRKAEEAKKKAALKAKSEESAAAPDAKEKQSSAMAAKTSNPEDSSPPAIELSMADMEDVPARSAVPNLDTPIIFEDEEDYVLPSSVGSPITSGADSKETQSSEKKSASDEALADEDEATPDRVLPASLADFESYEDTDAQRPEVSDETDSEASPAPERVLPSSLADFENFEDADEQRSGASEEADASPVPERVLPSSLADFENFEDTDEQRPEASEEIDSDAGPETSRVAESGERAAAQSDEDEDDMPAAAEAKAKPAEEPQPRDIGEREVRAKVRQIERQSEEPGRKVAQNVFAAKKSSILTNRKTQIVAGSSVFLLLVAFGIYFYFSLNQESAFNIPAGSYVSSGFVDDGNDVELEAETLDSDAVTVDVSAETTGLANLDIANDTSSQTSVLEDFLQDSEFPEVVVAPEPNRSAANLQPTSLDEEVPALATVATTVGDVPVEEAEPVSEPTQNTASEAEVLSVSEPTNLISFRRQANVTAVDPNLGQAYAAYQQGSLEEAEQLYRRALASDPQQRDALLGLATIATQRGNSAEALDLYSRMLARNPRDPIARAGLMELLPAVSPANQEADLKRLLNEYPNVAALAYAHGNFLASNQRWSEAQRAYFRALQLAKTDAAVSGQINPDYAFNLAVSLEHLNQRVPAETYYREALELATSHPAGFDLVAVRARLANLAGSSVDE